MKFTGVMPALVTPLDSAERVRTDVVEQLVKFFVKNGASGFYVAGGTGEGLAIRPGERRRLAEAAVASAGKTPCIMQIASTDFNEAIALAKHAESIGSAAISATPPLFFRYCEDDVFNYYKALADAVHIPVIIYNSPLAGFPLTPDFLNRTFQVDNITGVKWTSSDYFGLMRLKQLTNGEMNVLNGPDEMLLMGLVAGADGGIGSTYNFMFRWFRGVYDAYQERDLEKAMEYQNKVVRIIAAMRRYNLNSIALDRAIFTEMGFDVGRCAFPLTYFDEAKTKEVVRIMREEGWNEDAFGC
ncbi:MAG: dihydrodipicolinate synthase family protein [Clostridia bacterium]|nr:dihydrodipicolinate synthase family protein [Clostridia bacterium]